MQRRHLHLALFGALCCLLLAFVFYGERIPGGTVIKQRLRGQATVADRTAQYGPAARARWRPYFLAQAVAYPPPRLLLIGLKQEKRLEVYAGNSDRNLHFIRDYRILGSSGDLGPKLRFGDMQVPEGFYRIESLNPNSAFHLALRVNYPSAADRAQARRDGRRDLGGDIMIHGSNASIGCLAMGDEAAEDLFVLAADTGLDNIQLLLSPVDFRFSKLPPDTQRPPWTSDLYTRLKAAFTDLPPKTS